MAEATGDLLKLINSMISGAGQYIAHADDDEDKKEMQASSTTSRSWSPTRTTPWTRPRIQAAPQSRAAVPCWGRWRTAKRPSSRPTASGSEAAFPTAPNPETSVDGRGHRTGGPERANFDDLVVTVDHVGLPLGRYPNTLALEDRSDGMHWSVDPPASRADVREAIQRGDLKGGSWRMVVGKDEWRGNTRHVQEIRSLRDVAIVTTGAYPADAAAVELRSQPNPAKGQEAVMAEQAEQHTTGALNVEDRTEKPQTETRDFHEILVDSIRDVKVGETRSINDSEWMNLTEVRALASSGSPLSPTDLSTNLFQALRASSIALQSGIGTIQTMREKVTWPKLTVDTAPGFVSEGGTIPYGDPTFVSITSEPMKLAHLVAVSNEVIDDSDPPVLQVLTGNITTTLGLRLDSAIYVGGTALPGITGMNNLASTQIGGTITTAGTAGPTSYPQLIKGIGLLRAANSPPPYVLAAHPNVVTAFQGLQDTLFQQVEPYVGTAEMYSSTQINAGTAYLYSPAQSWVVRRADAEIQIDRSRLFNSDQSEIRGRVRVNYVCPNPASIVKLTAG